MILDRGRRGALGGTAGILLCTLSAQFLCTLSAQAADIDTAVRESYATNESMLTQATTAAVAELFLGFNLPLGASILVEPASDHRANWFVETFLLAYLSEAEYQAYLTAVTTTLPGEEAAPHQGEPGSLAEILGGASPDSVAESLFESGPDTLAVPSPEVSPVPPGSVETAQPPGRGQPDYVLRYRTVLCEITYPEKFRTTPFGSRKVQRRASVSLVAQVLRGGREDVIWVGKGSVERLNTVPASKLDLLAGTTFPFNPPALEPKSMSTYVEPVLVTGIVAGLIYLFYANQD